MLIAAPYTNDDRWRDLPDEYNIVYSNTSTLKKLIDFCELYPNKRINITFKNRNIDFNILKEINKIHSDIAVRIIDNQFDKIEEMKKNNIKFFFDEDVLPCYSFSLFEAMIEWGISDIYIFENLCYHMKDVKNICTKHNIKTRLIINTIPLIDPQRGMDYKAPIFCPKDEEKISNFIDVIEFDCKKENDIYDWHLFNVLYKTWKIKKNWVGDLREINKDLKIFFPHQSYSPYLFEKRFNCGRQCVFETSNKKCQRCELAFDLTNILYDRGGIIQL